MVKVAVIGPEEIVTRVIEQGDQVPELTLFPLPYTNENKALEHSLSISNQVDIILYTGPVPYMIARNHEKLPDDSLMYINYGGTGLYRVLFQMIRDGFIQEQCGNKVSIDFLDRVEVIEAFEELEIDHKDIMILEHHPFMTSEQIIEHHRRLWNEGRVSAVITCLYSVYKQIKQSGIPVYCVIPTRSAILNSLNMALARGKNKLFDNNQIAACQLSFECNEGISKMIDVISQTLQTSGQQIEENTYLFYTTKGLLYNLTDGFHQLPPFMEKFTGTIWMGVGMGVTAKEAMHRSHHAHLKSREESGDCLYIVGDHNTVIRIDGMDEINRIQYNSRTYDQTLQQVASATHLSVSTLSKIKYVLNALGKDDLTAAELADLLNITLRSARRILKALSDRGYARIVGGEQPILRGRPRKVYKLMM